MFIVSYRFAFICHFGDASGEAGSVGFRDDDTGCCEARRGNRCECFEQRHCVLAKVSLLVVPSLALQAERASGGCPEIHAFKVATEAEHERAICIPLAASLNNLIPIRSSCVQGGEKIYRDISLQVEFLSFRVFLAFIMHVLI